MTQTHHRMIDKENKPSDEEIIQFIGEQAKEAWQGIIRFLGDSYGIVPETTFYGAKYGWTIRYRKSGRTLCSLFPEEGGFTVLITLGGKEAEKALAIREELSARVREILGGTKQLHDGRWLWIRVETVSEIEDLKTLLKIKRKPKRSPP